MKKLVALILTGVLLSGCITALAATNAEIWFKHFSWGQDRFNLQQQELAEGVRGIREEDILNDNGKIYPVMGIIMGSPVLEAEKVTGGYYDGIGVKSTIIKEDYPEVAGYKTSAVNYYFVYGVNNGELVTDWEPSQDRFYSGQYVFDNPADISTMFDDLMTKLTGLYGEPDETKAPTETPAEDKHVFWYGDRETGVALSIRCADENGAELNQITITYFWLGADALLEEAHNALHGLVEKPEPTPNNSGL